MGSSSEFQASILSFHMSTTVTFTVGHSAATAAKKKGGKGCVVREKTKKATRELSPCSNKWGRGTSGTHSWQS
jgi:hypothetical protein